MNVPVPSLRAKFLWTKLIRRPSTPLDTVSIANVFRILGKQEEVALTPD